VNLYQRRAPFNRFFLANEGESTTLNERNQAARDLACISHGQIDAL
jgi:hypothetical protein